MTLPPDPRERAFDALIRSRIDEGLAHLDSDQPMPEPALAAAVDVIVPVHDAHDAFARCLASLLATLGPAHRLVLIDDASTDPRIWQAMRQAAADRAGTQIQRHARNRGYLQTVNAAIAATSRDVVLLNSDTEVGPGWLDRLAAAAHDGERAGLACPLSDNATLLSVVATPAVAGVNAATLQRHVVASARAPRPRLPVAVGFCLYVRRAVFDAIGLFDPAFDPGYGEESDFSMRAMAAGFEIVVATDVLVRHRAGSSFGRGGEIDRRRLVHATMIRQRWPAHDGLIQSWWRDWPLREQAERLRSSLAGGRPRVLQISHGLQRLGGIELHSRMLAASLAREFDVDLVAPEPLAEWSDLRDIDQGPGWTLRALNRRMQVPNQRLFGVAADLGDPVIERQLLRMLVGGGYRILHVHSLLRWNTLMPALLAKAVGVRVVVSLHDMSSLCPNYLMLPRDAPTTCGKTRAGIDGGCIACLAPYRLVTPGAALPDPQTHLDARWHVWKRTLEVADAIVAPTQYLIDRIAEGFGRAIAERIVRIPHGLAAPPAALQPRLPNTILRVGFLFGENRGKGSERLLAIAAQLTDRPLRFVVHAVHDRSALPPALPANIEWRPPYAPEQLAEVLADLDLVLMPTIVGETWSLALSECLAAGVPVMASRHGAFAERIRDGVDGWLLSVDRIDDWVAHLRWLETAGGRAALAEVGRNAAALPIIGIDANADRYLALYRSLLDAPAAGGPTPARTIRVDIASRRLSEAIRDGALAPAPAMPREPAPLPPAPSAMPRLRVAVRAHAGNRGRLAATLASVQALAPHADVVTLDDDAAASVKRSARSFHGPETWHVLVDAGDRLHPHALHWLARHAGSAISAVCADFDHLDGDGRRYAPVAQAGWDPWRALTDLSQGVGLFVRGDAWLRCGGWSRHRAAARHAMQLALVRDGQPVAVPGRLLLHRDDASRSADCTDAARREHVAVLREHLDAGWSIDGISTLPGWRCRPPLLQPPRVVIVVWSERGVGADEVEALRHAIQWPDVIVVAAAADQVLPDCDVVGFWRSDVGGIDHAALACLLAWLLLPSIAAVAPRRCLPSGEPLSDGIAIEHALPSRRDANGKVDAGVMRLAAASTACLLVRREHVDAGALQGLAAVDGVVSSGIQLAWQRDAQGDVLLVADVQVVQSRADAALDAKPEPAPAAGMDQVWNALGAEQRQALCRRSPERAGMSLVGVPKRLPRVVALTRDDWASSQYRVHLPLGDLAAEGLIDVPLVWRLRQERGPGLRQLAIEQPDVLVMHHAFDDASLRLMEQVTLSLRIPIVLLVDDLIDAVPAHNPMRQHMPPDMPQRLRHAIELCSCLVVTSDALSNAYGKRAWRCQVIENALPLERWSALPMPVAADTARLRIGWAGAQQHEQDLDLIDGLVRSRPDLQWVFMGMAPASAAAVNAEVHPMCAYENYPEALAALRLDLAVVPLVDDAFNRAKSALKLIEFGALGVPVIASDLPPYRHGPILRVVNDAAAWRTAVNQMASDPVGRRQAGADLRDWVRREHGQAGRRAAWCDALSLPLPDAARNVMERGS